MSVFNSLRHRSFSIFRLVLQLTSFETKSWEKSVKLSSIDKVFVASRMIDCVLYISIRCCLEILRLIPFERTLSSMVFDLGSTSSKQTPLVAKVLKC